MRVATQSQVTTKVNAIKSALNSFNYSHKCIYYYANNSINSSWGTNITLPNDGVTYKVVLCYTFSANSYNASTNTSRQGMIIDLSIGGDYTERIVQGFSSACSYQYGASKNNISTGMLTSNYNGSGQTVPVSITLNFIGSSTLQEGEALSGFQLAVMKIPERLTYERV